MEARLRTRLRRASEWPHWVGALTGGDKLFVFSIGKDGERVAPWVFTTISKERRWSAGSANDIKRKELQRKAERR